MSKDPLQVVLDAAISTFSEKADDRELRAYEFGALCERYRYLRYSEGSQDFVDDVGRDTIEAFKVLMGLTGEGE